MDHPIVLRIKSGNVPQAAKLNAARGLLPIPTDDLLELLVFLSNDDVDEVRATARKTLAEFPEERLLPVVSADEAPSAVLAHFAINPCSDQVSEAILLNPDTPDGAIEQLASVLPQRLLEILIRNEVRLIRHPPILEAVASNPEASPAVCKRAEEIRRDFIDKVAPAAAAEPEETEPLVDTPEEIAEETDQEAAVAEPAAQEEEEEEEEAPAGEEEPSASVVEALRLEQAAEEGLEDKDLTLEQKIMKMTVPEKIKLAHLGGRQARMILIRDPNRTVCNSVLGGGKMSQQEAELVSQFRNIDDEILRKIAATKLFIKSYTVALNLVRNPRTPIGVAMPLMHRLQSTDLKRLQNNNNVAGMIREQAKRMLRNTRFTGKR